jgi:hypothetical protein
MDQIRRQILTALAAAAALGAASSALADKKGGNPHDQHGGSAKEPGKGQGKAKGKAKHRDGKKLLGDKLKQNGRHKLDQQGDFTSEVDVQGGKVAGVHVKHAKKGDVKVTKYKTDKQVVPTAQIETEPRFIKVQDEYLGTRWIGYSYIDDYGEEEIYWFPVDVILDGDTGAIYYDYGPDY